METENILRSGLKTGFILSALLVLGFLSSCGDGNVGPIGPQGPQGPSGPQGEAGESGFVFEWEGVSFTGPQYEVFLGYPTEFEGLDSDVALVYFLWETQEDSDGNLVEVWRALPQTLITENGLLIYNFDHTKFDVRLFLDADFDLDLLTAIDTDDWVVRVVVVPGNFWNGRTSIDHNDYEAVQEYYGLPQLDVRREGVIERRLD